MRKKHWMLSPWFIIFAAVMLLMTTISANYNMAVFYTELGVTIAATAVVFVLSLRFSAYIRGIVKSTADRIDGVDREYLERYKYPVAVVGPEGDIAWCNARFRKAIGGRSPEGDHINNYISGYDYGDIKKIDENEDWKSLEAATNVNIEFDYLGTYNLCKITMGSLVMAPDDYDYGGAYMELKEGDTLTFNDGTETEEEPYTVDGTTFSLEENGSTLKGTIENDCIALTLTAADLGGEGDAEAMVMYFGLAGSEAETKLKDEVTQAGTLDEQMEAMGTDGLMQFMEDYGYLFGQ